MARLTPSEPPPEINKSPDHDWPNMVEVLRKNPDTWMEMDHHFTTPRSARASVWSAAKRYDLEYRVVHRGEGPVQVFLKWKGEDDA